MRAAGARAARRSRAELAAYKTERDQLRAELNQVKRHVGYPAGDIF